MSWYNEISEKLIDSYDGEHRKGLFGKKCPIKLHIYPSHIEGVGYSFTSDELSNESEPFSLSYLQIREIYEESIAGNMGVVIEYIEDSVVTNSTIFKIALLGISEPTKCTQLLLKTKEKIDQQNRQAKLAKEERERREKELKESQEMESLQFYNDCLNFHLKNTTPKYELYKDKHKIALIYISEDKALNFLKIDGEAKEESNGIIPFEKIHYYEKAGDIHYVSELHGDYSNYGGSVTGGQFSKLAVAGGGLLFGIMGMTAGALLSYKPTQTEAEKTNFSLDSTTKEIDSRSIILNFYSDIKKQYIDIELPNDIYNFLQTYLPEKKYNIVLELEKKTAIHNATTQIESGKLLNIAPTPESNKLEDQQATDQMAEFKKKVEKLKIMKDSGLLSDEEFNLEKSKLLDMI